MKSKMKFLVLSALGFATQAFPMQTLAELRAQASNLAQSSFSAVRNASPRVRNASIVGGCLVIGGAAAYGIYELVQSRKEAEKAALQQMFNNRLLEAARKNKQADGAKLKERDVVVAGMRTGEQRAEDPAVVEKRNESVAILLATIPDAINAIKNSTRKTFIKTKLAEFVAVPKITYYDTDHVYLRVLKDLALDMANSKFVCNE